MALAVPGHRRVGADHRLLPSAKHGEAAARRFLRRALGRENTCNPCIIVTDWLTSYPGALREMSRDGDRWRFAPHRCGR